MLNHFNGKVAVKIFLTDESGDLLVCRQNESEDFEVVGGRIDSDESIKNCIQREICEELGIEIDFEECKIINSFQAVNPHENINHLYLIIRVEILDNKKRDIKMTEEVGEIAWLNSENYKNYKYKKFLENSINNFLHSKVNNI